MEMDKKICIICKKQIEDEKEYICSECYEKTLEEAKQNELWQELQKIDKPDWFLGAILVFALFGNKGENK